MGSHEEAGRGGFPDIDYSMLDDEGLIGIIAPNVLRGQGVPVNPETLRAADAILNWALDCDHFDFGGVGDPEISAADELAARISQRDAAAEGQG